jgi:uncharacterized protein RhaS with RHS repeats
MRPASALLMATLWLGMAHPVLAQETETFTYDAQGRLVKVEHSGGPVGGMQVSTTYDKAGNRTNVTVTGAKPLLKVIVVPLNGYTIIPVGVQ